MSTPMSTPAETATFVTDVLPVNSSDGHRSELIVVTPKQTPLMWLYWLPAMGVPAKHYLPFAQAFAARGVAVALHEWRGIGSSSVRAGRRNDWRYQHLLTGDIPAGFALASARWPQLKGWVGGHSLGGQLSCLYASLHPDQLSGIALVASGAPYWRQFRRGAWIGLAYGVAALTAQLLGYLPGRRLGFGGNEARGVVADWSRSGRRGVYAARAMSVDFPARLAEQAAPICAVRLRDDWMVPQASLDWLLATMPNAPRRVTELNQDALQGQAADHFAWMKAPEAVVASLDDMMRSAARA